MHPISQSNFLKELKCLGEQHKHYEKKHYSVRLSLHIVQKLVKRTRVHLYELHIGGRAGKGHSLFFVASWMRTKYTVWDYGWVGVDCVVVGEQNAEQTQQYNIFVSQRHQIN